MWRFLSLALVLLLPVQTAQSGQSNWHLAKMAGQGEYYILQDHPEFDTGTQGGIECVLAAKNLNQQMLMWRYICVEEP